MGFFISFFRFGQGTLRGGGEIGLRILGHCAIPYIEHIIDIRFGRLASRPIHVQWRWWMDGIIVRQGALKALDWVLKEKRLLAHLPEDVTLAPPDRARVARLTRLVLRHLGPADMVLRAHLNRPPPWPVQMVLRLATVEILVTGAASHGVVNSAVHIVKTNRKMSRHSGLVNAVLRRVVTEGSTHWQSLPPQRLPAWIGREVKKHFGPQALRAIERAHAQGAPLDITPKYPNNTLPEAQILPTGGLRLPGGRQVSALPGYADGTWWVQDAAAALPVRLLGDVAGQQVLDLCAAPGGKTMQLAAAGADVTAVDISPSRMDQLRTNLRRTGLNATLLTEDALSHRGTYNAVVLDAPCSATGTIRRHPDLPFVKSARDVEPLTRLQMHLIDHAITLVRPGGRFVYCTCSLLPVEGEFQIKAALARHSTLSLMPLDPTCHGGEPEWRSPHGGLRLRPDFWAEWGGMDGFYIAILEVG